MKYGHIERKDRAREIIDVRVEREIAEDGEYPVDRDFLLAYLQLRATEDLTDSVERLRNEIDSLPNRM